MVLVVFVIKPEVGAVVIVRNSLEICNPSGKAEFSQANN